MEEEFATYFHNGVETNYLISNYGRVYSLKSNRFLEPRIFNGYETLTLYINFTRPSIFIHRMVASTFIYNDDPENKTQVDHINGDKLDNFVDNLDWVSPAENIKRGHDNGLISKKFCEGEKSKNSKYTEKQVRRAFELMEEGWYGHDISNEVGIPYKYLCEMFSGRVWKSVSKDYDLSKRRKEC